MYKLAAIFLIIVVLFGQAKAETIQLVCTQTTIHSNTADDIFIMVDCKQPKGAK
jgi:hypothetical protein